MHVMVDPNEIEEMADRSEKLRVRWAFYILLGRMEVDRDLSSNPELTRSLSKRIHRTHWIPIGKITSSRPSLRLKTNRAGGPGEDGVACQCVPVGRSYNDEEWRDNLFVVMIRQQNPKVAVHRENGRAVRTWVWVTIGKKILATELLTAHGTTNSMKVTA